MSIKETLEKIKPFYTLLLLVVFSVIFFALGRLSVQNSQKTGINIANPKVYEASQTATAISSVTATTSITRSTLEMVIGSKSGKKYYFPWCGTVKRIKPENQVKFNSIEEAKSAGFAPGGNCKGLN